MNQSIVIIPTFNEKENIEKIVRKVISLDQDFDILVVDDNSPDGTAKIVQEIQGELEEVHLLQRSGKNGLGTAYIDGFRWALSREYDFIFEMDADFSHNPEDLDRLRQACLDGADLSIGSRYIEGGGLEDWPWLRRFLSKGASHYTNAILNMGIKDVTAGFKCYTRKVLEALPLDEINFVGYAFQIEMKYRAFRKGFKLAEVPITFKDRTEGKSKMNAGIAKEALFGIMKLKRMKLG
ncbi:MAG: polyprenol monophosphomannose synthase [Bacteroidota bacterium]